MITTTCPGCSSTFTVNDSLAGKRGKCKKCGELLKIPGEAPAEAGPQLSPYVVEPEPVIVKHDAYGAWCPHCGNRCSVKSSQGGFVLILLILLISGVFLFFLQSSTLAIITVCVGLVLLVFLPNEWACRQCKHRWRG